MVAHMRLAELKLQVCWRGGVPRCGGVRRCPEVSGGVEMCGGVELVRRCPEVSGGVRRCPEVSGGVDSRQLAPGGGVEAWRCMRHTGRRRAPRVAAAGRDRAAVSSVSSHVVYI